jgi:hypothetical protein
LASINTLYYIHLVAHLEGGEHNVAPNPTLTYSGTGRTYQRDSIVGCRPTGTAGIDGNRVDTSVLALVFHCTDTTY